MDMKALWQLQKQFEKKKTFHILDLEIPLSLPPGTVSGLCVPRVTEGGHQLEARVV